MAIYSQLIHIKQGRLGTNRNLGYYKVTVLYDRFNPFKAFSNV
jgi:hypothetical protein